MCDPQEAIYVGDSLTKDIYMAGLAGVTSVLVDYPKAKNNYYKMLVDITSWSTEDFEREAALKKKFIDSNMKPDYIINNFSELIKIFSEE